MEFAISLSVAKNVEHWISKEISQFIYYMYLFYPYLNVCYIFFCPVCLVVCNVNEDDDVTYLYMAEDERYSSFHRDIPWCKCLIRQAGYDQDHRQPGSQIPLQQVWNWSLHHVRRPMVDTCCLKYHKTICFVLCMELGIVLPEVTWTFFPQEMSSFISDDYSMR